MNVIATTPIRKIIHIDMDAFYASVEPLSLDETYLDVTENLKGMEIATEIALEIRAKIKQTTSLNASVGISYNKFLAKMASDLNKPNGQAVITPKNGPAFVEQLPVKKFHGVGPATAEKMHRLGIETGADLRSKPLQFLVGNRRKCTSSAGPSGCTCSSPRRFRAALLHTAFHQKHALDVYVEVSIAALAGFTAFLQPDAALSADAEGLVHVMSASPSRHARRICHRPSSPRPVECDLAGTASGLEPRTRSASAGAVRAGSRQGLGPALQRYAFRIRAGSRCRSLQRRNRIEAAGRRSRAGIDRAGAADAVVRR